MKKTGYIDDPNQSFWLSIKPLSKCLFSRRNGIIGKRFLGYSLAYIAWHLPDLNMKFDYER